jgi:hypothetical protein
LQDIQAIAEELKVARPSAAARMRLLEWVKQAEAVAAAMASAPTDESTNLGG